MGKDEQRHWRQRNRNLDLTQNVLGGIHLYGQRSSSVVTGDLSTGETGASLTNNH